MGFLLLGPEEIQDLVSMAEAIDAVEKGYAGGHEYPVINAPRRRVHSPAGVRISNFPGGVHDMGVIGAATRADRVVQLEGGENQEYAYREHPIHVLNDSNTGHLLALVIGEPVEKTLGYTSLVALRTAATSGVAFKYMVRDNARVAGVFGSGGQAANQLLALLSVRPGIKKVKVYSRDPDNRLNFARKYAQKFDVEITPVDHPDDVIKGSDAIVCATNTNVELFDGNLLEPGQHVTGIIGGNVQLVQGGFLKKARREIDNRTVERADVIVTNLKESVISEKQGDLYEPIEQGIITLDDIIDLGELPLGLKKGRNNDAEITYHKNNNGTAASEIAVAMLVYEKAKAAGRGTMMDLIDPEALREQFTQ
ncbi:MAG: ornithine cyclodeaminase family protein [Rhodospirillaceae bacterium]|jgi:ornithine cyclodeaminase|nr:ornithine cyclodeaminase family protein [Rhodospirillaceae bacterium]MBT5456902.1 ornithine cyclodeaminase family protein [Rhodospirillaceae bacterium]